MTELNTKKYKSTNGKTVDSALNNDELSKLDKIRDMLFGEQVDTLQRQCSKLDNSLEKNISSLRKDMQTSIDELKKQVDANFKQLQKELSQEQVERESQNEQLGLALKSSSADLVTKLDLETKRLNEVIDDRHDESTKKLNDFVESLQTDKVDKSVLEKFLSDFASELKNSK